MATETKTRIRKPKTDHKAKLDKLAQYCQISLDVIAEVSTHTGDSDMKQFFNGQSDALKAVLRHIGAEEK